MVTVGEACSNQLSVSRNNDEIGSLYVKFKRGREAAAAYSRIAQSGASPRGSGAASIQSPGAVEAADPAPGARAGGGRRSESAGWGVGAVSSGRGLGRALRLPAGAPRPAGSSVCVTSVPVR